MGDQTRGPLSGVRVLDLSCPMGQAAGRSLADLGADVILVEPPSGSDARSLAPFAGGAPDAERSIFHLHFNTNKRGIVLDLTSEEGRRDFSRLVSTADVVLESFAPGHLASLGLGYEVLEAQRPGLVLTSITPFGQTGPYRDFEGGALIGDATGGEVRENGSGQPVAQPRYQSYQMAGLHAAYGTLLALWHSRRTGQGQQVDVSVHEVTAHAHFNFMRYAAYQHSGGHYRMPGWASADNYYPCADGWVYLSMIHPYQWKAFSEWSQDPVLIASPYEDHVVKAEPEELYKHISAFLSTMTVEQCVTDAVRWRVPIGPVNDVPSFVEHPHTSARGFMVEVEHPMVGRYRAPGAHIIYPASPWRIRRPAPTLGQHTTEVLSDLREMPANGARPAIHHGDGRETDTSLSLARLPLEAIRVLDLSKAWAGPFAARFLGDFGADVVRVESFLFPDYRTLSKEPNPGVWYRSNAMYAEINRNKRSITLDLHTEGGQELFKRLIAESDILIENYHYAALPKWGLDYESLKQINPRLIMLSAPGFGSSGPARDYFALAGCIGSFAGLTYLWSHPDSEPIHKGRGGNTDFVTAIQLALAAMAALHHRESTGEGQHVEVPQVESAASMVGSAILEYTLNGVSPQPWGNRDPNFAPQNLYACLGHNRWCAISCQTDAQWLALCTVMGGPLWAQDARFDSVAGRLEHHDEIDAGIAEWTRDFTPHQVMLKCQASGVPAGVVASGEDLYLDPQLRERDYVVEIDHPAPGRLEHPGMTVCLTRTPGRVRLPAPLTGEHNEEVFGQLLGLSAQERIAWKEAGALA
jgi:crotonobetainyl-CoA:carnitine CoA-transferase CaiB-like acyl-CoA transferase